MLTQVDCYVHHGWLLSTAIALSSAFFVLAEQVATAFSEGPAIHRILQLDGASRIPTSRASIWTLVSRENSCLTPPLHHSRQDRENVPILFARSMRDSHQVLGEPVATIALRAERALAP